MPGHVSSEASAIDNAGRVIGRSFGTAPPWHFAPWSNGTVRDLGPMLLGDPTQASVLAMNDSGFVIGAYQSRVGRHGYLLTLDGSIVDIADLIDPADPPAAQLKTQQFTVSAINAAGVISATMFSSQSPFTAPILLVPR